MSTFSKQLLVEGNDDMHVLMSLCQKFSVAENFEIIDCKGIDKLFTQIPIRLKQSGFQTLGIIIDADIAISSRWTSLQSIFLKQGILLPNEIPNEGLILKANGFTIGIWIMPNNDQNGMLEDFITFLIPKEDKLLPFANKTLDAIEKENMNKYIPAHKSKALIHSWLSWQEDPGTPMGLAITKKFLTTQEEICQKLISWLTGTFQ
jgi:hypothetical protein